MNEHISRIGQSNKKPTLKIRRMSGLLTTEEEISVAGSVINGIHLQNKAAASARHSSMEDDTSPRTASGV
jgi:hypothetical protein